MPEVFRAFCRMVSFTAANTKLTLAVSVACVRLNPSLGSAREVTGIARNVLRVNRKVCPISLHVSPEDVFSSLVDISTARVLWEISLQWDLTGYKTGL